MSPERAGRLVSAWVRLYTRGLSRAVAERRVAEIAADVHDQIAHQRTGGMGDRRIALSIAGRLLRGAPADLAWRSRAAAASRSAARSAARIAVVTTAVLLIPAAGMLLGSDGVDWGVFDFVFAGALVATTGLLYELAARSRRAAVYRVTTAALGGAAVVLGEAGDAPGLVLFGGLVLLSSFALARRAAPR